MWTAQVLPHMNEAATDLATLKAAIAGGLDAAGAAHGFRAKSEGAPWNFPVKAAGTVVAAKTDTRAATADIDIDGDGTADATVQLGPVIRGTTLRDVQPFIDFTAFRDQIAFAELARALNDQAYKTALEAVPRDALVGQEGDAGRGLHDEGGGRSDPDHAGQLRGGAVSEIGLSIRGAVKVYPGTRALDDVDFDVRMGAVNVLVGENGAGKSTLMKVIAGVEQLTAGEIADGRQAGAVREHGGGGEARASGSCSRS